MRPPEFWLRNSPGWPPPILEIALTPAAWLYGAAVTRRQQTSGLRLPIPVISVGGVTVGGSGKTPVARAVRAKLAELGVRTAIVSRGHGGVERGPLAVDLAKHTARDVGDEPLLHAMDGPAWIARDRAAGGVAAWNAGAEALILDDAHQNPALVKDLALLVLDGRDGLGNGRVFPAGPLREPLTAALARADAIVLTREPETVSFEKLLLRARLIPLGKPPAGPLVAFAGIAFPDRFRQTLLAAGGEVVDLAPFPDHHRFTTADLRLLKDLALRHGARLITTEKDWVRLPPEAQSYTTAFPVSLQFDQTDALDHLLQSAMRRRP